MIVVVNHKINDIDEFWASAEESLKHLPASGVQRIILVMPNSEMTEATCVWEADSIESIDKYIQATVGSFATASFHEVNPEQALGLSVLLDDN
jgi:hypothetical protein